jgi:transcriptional regulator NrdR family protein
MARKNKLHGTLNEKIHTTLEKVRSWIVATQGVLKIPSADERRRFTHAKILKGMKKMGVASQAEVDELNAKVRKLESALKVKPRSSPSTTSPR